MITALKSCEPGRPGWFDLAMRLFNRKFVEIS